MLDTLLDALIDALKIFPFLFLIYLIMEIIELKSPAAKIRKVFSGRLSPLAGGIAGFIPECGVSAMYAKLYENRIITAGTLLATFIAASDEGIIILITDGASALSIILTVLIKFSFALIVGFTLNAILKKREVLADIGEGVCIECKEKQETKLDKFFLHPLFHSFIVFLYVLAVNVVFGVIIYFIGEEKISSFLSSNFYLEPAVAGLVGLIPNCASSVLIAKSFTGGMLSLAGLISGLSANAGIGIAVLFKNGKNVKRNLFILLTLYLLSVLLGYIVAIFLSL